MKSKKPNKSAHTPNTALGSGNFYGTGTKAKLGTMKEGVGMKKLTSKKLLKPPKSLA